MCDAIIVDSAKSADSTTVVAGVNDACAEYADSTIDVAEETSIAEDDLKIDGRTRRWSWIGKRMRPIRPQCRRWSRPRGRLRKRPPELADGSDCTTDDNIDAPVWREDADYRVDASIPTSAAYDPVADEEFFVDKFGEPPEEQCESCCRVYRKSGVFMWCQSCSWSR